MADFDTGPELNPVTFLLHHLRWRVHQRRFHRKLRAAGDPSTSRRRLLRMMKKYNRRCERAKR